MDMSLSKLQDLVMEAWEACRVEVHGFTKSDTTKWMNWCKGEQIKLK